VRQNPDLTWAVHALVNQGGQRRYESRLSALQRRDEGIVRRLGKDAYTLKRNERARLEPAPISQAQQERILSHAALPKVSLSPLPTATPTPEPTPVASEVAVATEVATAGTPTPTPGIPAPTVTRGATPPPTAAPPTPAPTAIPGLQYYSAGVELLRSGDAPSAIVELQKAAKANPNSADFRSELGWAYFQAKKMPQAVKELENAVRLNQLLPRTHLRLGLVFENIGRYPEACVHFENYLKLAPDAADAAVVQQRRARMNCG
jgi:TolA-binding protein